jgi:arylsulfatase
MATCLDVSDTPYPEREGIEPLQGKSLIPLLQGEPRGAHEELYFIFRENRALRTGDWKLVSFYGHRWELYNLSEDRMEQHDLASEFPDLVSELSERWYLLAEEKDRVPEKWRTPVKDAPAPLTWREWHRPELTREWQPYSK